MSASLVLVTPTFAGDLSRFALLRRSARELGVDLPHVAVVQTEDLDEFRRAFAGDPSLTLVATADVLPPEVESARRRGSGRRPRTPRGLTVRALQALPRWTWSISGWRAQQLTKLLAGPVVGAERWVCLDSDTVFLAPVQADDFYAEDGRLVLHRLVSPGDQEPVTRSRSAALLGLDPTSLDPSTFYVDQAVPFHGRVVNDLLAYVTERHQLPFHQAFQRFRATEFMTYGLYADHVHVGDLVAPRQLALIQHFYAFDREDFRRTLPLARAEGKRMAMVHSMLGVDPSVVEQEVERLWRSS